MMATMFVALNQNEQLNAQQLRSRFITAPRYEGGRGACNECGNLSSIGGGICSNLCAIVYTTTVMTASHLKKHKKRQNTSLGCVIEMSVKRTMRRSKCKPSCLKYEKN